MSNHLHDKQVISLQNDINKSLREIDLLYYPDIRIVEFSGDAGIKHSILLDIAIGWPNLSTGKSCYLTHVFCKFIVQRSSSGYIISNK